MTHHTRRNTAAKDIPQSEIDLWVVAIGIIVFLAEVVVISGAFSPFRIPKMVLALGGLALVIGGRAAFRLWQGRLELPFGPLVTALVVLPALQALSALWAATPALALRQALFSAAWVAIALGLATLTADQRRWILAWGVWGAVVSGIVLLGQLSEVGVATPQGFHAGDRLGLIGLAGNPSDLAMGALLFLPLLLSEVLARPQKWARWLLPGFLIVTAVLAQSLTGLVAVALISVGFVALMRSKKVWCLALVLAVVAALAISVSPLRTRIQAEWGQLQQGNWYNLLSAREDGWTAAVTMVKSSPMLGVGAGQYSREFYPARISWLERHDSVGKRGEMATHFEWAHNDPLQLVSELGLLGALWIALFVVALIRSGPPREAVLILAILVWTPFLLLHYPTHLAIGLIPAVLLLAHALNSAPRTMILQGQSVPGRVLAVVLGFVAISVAVAQVDAFRLDRWRGHTEAMLTMAQTAPAANRRQIMRNIEIDAAEKISQNRASAPWVWRIVGRARLLAGVYGEAEVAFRRSLALEPHEEAEMGLGLAFAGQGRTAEAIQYLVRACRVNPALLGFISDEDLQQSVRLRIRRKKTGSI